MTADTWAPSKDDWLRQYDRVTEATLATFDRHHHAAWIYLGRRLELSEHVRRRVDGPVNHDAVYRGYRHALVAHMCLAAAPAGSDMWQLHLGFIVDRHRERNTP